MKEGKGRWVRVRRRAGGGRKKNREGGEDGNKRKSERKKGGGKWDNMGPKSWWNGNKCTKSGTMWDRNHGPAGTMARKVGQVGTGITMTWKKGEERGEEERGKEKNKKTRRGEKGGRCEKGKKRNQAEKEIYEKREG